jgi:hypothetical protein
VKFVIERTYEEKGTPGILYDEANNPLCCTIERAKTGDHPCIDEGTYIASRYDSPKHGPNTWQLEDVSGRTHIQFHVANWPHQLLGCIAPGLEPAVSADGEPGVSSSRIAYNNFMKLTENEISIVFTIRSAL